MDHPEDFECGLCGTFADPPPCPRQALNESIDDLNKFGDDQYLEALKLLEHEDEDEELIGGVQDEVKVKVAMDSGAVAPVVNPDDLPASCQVIKDTSGKDFSGAGGERIRKYGTARTVMSGKHGRVECNWQVADVTRPLHSVSHITGPEELPVGRQGVIFSNKKCVVVPPGVVERILATVTPVAEYTRTGGLYLAEMTMSSFARQGLQP